MRDIKFENGEYYHIYNRGVDKRNIFNDKNDIWRFIKGVLIFNRFKVVGSIREELKERRIDSNLVTVNFRELIESTGELVEIIAICLNPNHFHILVKQVSDNGISKFMHKLGSGFTRYINEKNDRSGSLFQGTFKATYVENDDVLTYISAYINLNYEIHGIKDLDKKLVFSSWDEYCGKNKVMNICKGKNDVLKQFKNIEEYKKFAKEIAKESKELKAVKKEELEEMKEIDRKMWEEMKQKYLE